MDLRRKLARWVEANPASNVPDVPDVPDAHDDPRTASQQERIAHLRSLVGEVVAKDARRERAPRRPPQAPADVEAHDTPHGPLHIIARQFEPDHAHGRVAVRDALAVDPDVLALLALDRDGARFDPTRMLILDTETTGLSGGTGTVAFLVGLAWFEDGCLRTEQLFLRDLDREPPLLHRVAERIAAASVVVTYNGKSFDWPLLRTRFIMHRIAAPALPPHLDLLHCARRLLRGRLDGLRLTEVERGLLGHYREDDVDGSEIPGMYLRYLRGAAPETLARVFAHNADDLVALPAVLAALGARLGSVRAQDDPRDWLASARLSQRAGDAGRALMFARAVIDGAGDADARCAAHALVAAIEQCAERPAQALRAWQGALDAASDANAASAVHLALAKLYEHAFGDLDHAQHHARQTHLAEGTPAHERRVGRLQRRLDRRREAQRA